MREQSKTNQPRREKGLRVKRGKWEYRFQYGGQPIQKVTDFAATAQNRVAALAAMEGHKRNLLQGTVPERIVHIPFASAAAHFLEHYRSETKEHPNTAKRTSGSLGSLIVFFHQRAVSSIGVADVEDYKLHRREVHGVASSTLKNDLCALSLLLQFGKKRGWCAKNIVEEVELPSTKDSIRMTILADDLEERFFKAALVRSPELYDIGRIMLNQGCRPEELLSLEQSDIDFQKNKFEIRWGKSPAAKRRLLMTPETRQILEDRLKKPGRWVFPSPRIPAQHFANYFRAMEDVFTFFKPEEIFVIYDLRHTFATRFACGGCPLPTLARILGHGSLTSVYKYIHPSQEMMDEAMERFNSTGKPWTPPTMPVSARSFDDIVETLGHLKPLAGPTSGQFRANFGPTTSAKKGQLYIFGDKKERKGA